MHLLATLPPGQGVVTIAMGAFVTFIGLFSLAHLGKEFITIGRLRRRGIGTVGRVIDHVPGDTLDRPVIQFTDRQGYRFKFEVKRALLSRFVQVGEQFPVSYLSDQPSRSARVRSEKNFRSLLPALLGLLIFLSSGILLLAAPWIATGSTEPAGSAESILALPQAPLARSLTILLMGGLPGLSILFYVAWKIRRLYILRRDGLGATGTVTRMIKDDGVQLVIDFFDFKSRRMQFLSDRGPRQVGATVPVVYLRDRPYHATVAPALRNVRSLLLPALFGTLFLSVGVAGIAFKL